MAEVLVVCTGNICRSPIAEAMLRTAFLRRARATVPAVSSAGVIARDGHPATPEAVQAAAEAGVDISTHAARRLRPEQIRDADLIVCMAREHVEEVRALAPEAAARTFTLKQLVRLLEEGSEPQGPALPEPLARRVAAADRTRNGLVGESGDQDVEDPLGLALPAYRTVARELQAWCDRLADAVYGPARAPVGSEG
jgi:protein-tyrosine phosphatase